MAVMRAALLLLVAGAGLASAACPAGAITPAGLFSGNALEGAASDWTMVYSLDLPAFPLPANTPFSYASTTAVPDGTFTRAAYLMVLDSTWVWVSFPWAHSAGSLAIPMTEAEVLGRGLALTDKVPNVNIRSCKDGVPTGDNKLGRMEMFPHCYQQGPSTNKYDAYDVKHPTAAPFCFGSFQFHEINPNDDVSAIFASNVAAGNTLFAYNRWARNDATQCDAGIGNNPNGADRRRDWTTESNANSFTTRRLFAFVNVAEISPTDPPADETTAVPETTTAEDDETTTVPETTSDAEDDPTSSSAPKATTTEAAEDTTTVPETTEADDDTTTVPETTEADDDLTTTAPFATSTTPFASSSEEPSEEPSTPPSTSTEPETTVPTTTEALETAPCDADIIFVLDASYSAAAAFPAFKNVARMIVQQLAVGPSQHRVGLVTFLGNAILEFPLDFSYDKSVLMAKIDALQHPDGFRAGATGQAFKWVSKNIMSPEATYGWRGTYTYVVLLTDDVTAEDNAAFTDRAARLINMPNTFVIAIYVPGSKLEPQVSYLTSVSGAKYLLPRTVDIAGQQALADSVVHEHMCSDQPI